MLNTENFMELFNQSNTQPISSSSASLKAQLTNIHYDAVNTGHKSETSGNFSCTPTTNSLYKSQEEYQKSCIYCSKGIHRLSQCKDFLDTNVQLRRCFVKQNKLCVNCLQGFHCHRLCKSLFWCKTCTRRHHYNLRTFLNLEVRFHRQQQIKVHQQNQLHVIGK